MPKSKKSKRTKKPKKSVPKDTPFRLLDLPREIQTKIYEFHYADSNPELHVHDSAAGTLKFTSVPNLRLEQTCHEVSLEARKVKDKMMNKQLKISMVGDLDRSRLRDFCILDRYLWLRKHVNSLEIFTMNPFDPPDWKLLVGRCSNLQDVSIEICPRYLQTEFPEEMDDEEVTDLLMESALEGEYDDMVIELLDVMNTHRLIEVLGTRQEDPRVVARVRFAKLFVDEERESEDACIELDLFVGISHYGPEIVSRICQSKYACGMQTPKMEKPNVKRNAEETTAGMAMTKMALFLRAELRGRRRLGK